MGLQGRENADLEKLEALMRPLKASMVHPASANLFWHETLQLSYFSVHPANMRMAELGLRGKSTTTSLDMITRKFFPLPLLASRVSSGRFKVSRGWAALSRAWAEVSPRGQYRGSAGAVRGQYRGAARRGQKWLPRARLQLPSLDYCLDTPLLTSHLAT